MNVRSPLLVAAALLGAACATKQNRPTAPATEEVRLGGYRLVVPTDKSPDAKARAFDPEGKEIPVVTAPAEDVKVCGRKPGDSGVAPVCPALNAMLPKAKSLQTTAGKWCWYYDALGRIHYYQCG